MAPILIYATSVLALSMLDEAALSFLALGVQPPTASLGNMLNGAQSLTVLTQQPWLWVPPGLLIVILVMAINFIGDQPCNSRPVHKSENQYNAPHSRLKNGCCNQHQQNIGK